MIPPIFHAMPRDCLQKLFWMIYSQLDPKLNFGVPSVRELHPSGCRNCLPDGLETFGRPVRETSCECERSGIQLGPIGFASGPTVNDAISDPQNAIVKIAGGVRQ